MKKLFLAILLIALIIGVAYIKDWREDRNRQDVYAEGLEEGREEAGANHQAIDSLAQQLTETEQTYTDSLRLQAESYDQKVDSLRSALAGRDSTIEALESKATAVTAKPKVDADEQKRQRELTILAHYKQLYLALPADLSAYEKRVAIDEIRQKTADKYNISVASLNKTREKHGISY